MGSNGLGWEHPATDLKTFAYLEEGGGKEGKELVYTKPLQNTELCPRYLVYSI